MLTCRRLPLARELPKPRRALASAAVLLLGGAAPALAAHARAAAIPPAQAQAISATLEQAAGVSSSEVFAQDACPPAGPGYASCASQVLKLLATGQPVRPNVVVARPQERSPGALLSGTPSVASGGSEPAGQPAPGIGSPAWLQQAYDLSGLAATAGTFDTVAIVDAYDDPGAEQDLATYRSTYGLPGCTTTNGCFRKLNESGQASPLPSADAGWGEEESLDLDAVSALCPNCHIELIEANSNSWADLTAAMATAAASGAQQMSNSWAGGDASAPAGTYSWPGVSVIAATGDHGYLGAGVDAYPAAYPTVTAAGGTSLAAGGSGLRGFTETAWSLNSSGWGGGSGCALSVTKPSWQTDTGCAGRSYADLSADADPNTGLIVYDSAAGGWLLMGGTSLATPLIAAYEALTGVSHGTPQWAYTDSPLLNPITSGENGTCAPNILYICNAGPGYNGPGGEGSISGEVASGAPGIAAPAGSPASYLQSSSSTGASLEGGVWPNGLQTSYWWEYGTSTSYGSDAPVLTAPGGSGLAAATGTLTGLTPDTTYHLRLVAQNISGTTYGYDYTFTTAIVLTNTAPPQITGPAQEGQTLTVSNGSWSPAPTSYGYQWQRCDSSGGGCTDITGATASNYTPGGADVGDDLSAIVTAINGAVTQTAAAQAVGPVASGWPVNTAPPQVTGTLEQGFPLTASPGSWSAGTAISYQWQANRGIGFYDVAGATTSTYTPGTQDLNADIRVVVTGQNSYGSLQVTSAKVGPIATGEPNSTSAPSIATGTVEQGVPLSVAGTGGWSPAATSFGYQWQSNTGAGWADIGGATGSTYTPGVADLGAQIRVIVLGENAYGWNPAASASVGPVISGAPVNLSVGTISGTAEQGFVLSASAGTWGVPQPTSYAYKWQSNTGAGWTNLGGATARTYTPGVADLNATIRVLLTGINPYGQQTVAEQQVGPVASGKPVQTATPAVTGSSYQRYVALGAATGNWSPAASAVNVQWQRCSAAGSNCQNIAGATGTGYTPIAADEGATLRIVVTGANAYGQQTVTSAAVGPILANLPFDTSAPAIAGTAARGGQLQLSPGTWTPSDTVVAIQWQRCDTSGQNCTSISGATAVGYTVQVADEGHTLRATVSGGNPDGTVVAPTPPTAVVVALPPVPSTAPTVSGAAEQGSVLTLNPGTWTPADVTLSYQWQDCSSGSCTDIPGATGTSYTLGAPDVDQQVRATVTGANVDGTVPVATAPSAYVGRAPFGLTQPGAPSGTAQYGDTLTADPGTWDTSEPDAAGAWQDTTPTIAYQWWRCPQGVDAIDIRSCAADGTGPSLTLSAVDVGEQIGVTVSVSNAGGSATANSPLTAVVTGQPLLSTAPPTVTGTATIPNTLGYTPGTWNMPLTAQSVIWYRCHTDASACQNVGSGPSYQLSGADSGQAVKVTVTAQSPGETQTVSSALVNVQDEPLPVSTAAPQITGAAVRLSTLTASRGEWSNTPFTYAYQWQRCASTGGNCQTLPGATSASYALGLADAGSTLRVVVTAANFSGPVAAASATTQPVDPDAVRAGTAPTIAGVPQQGHWLSFAGEAWTNPTPDATFAQQWERCDAQGTFCTPITGAIGAIYQLTSADVGATIAVSLTATNPAGSATMAAPATQAIKGLPPQLEAAPVLETDPGTVGDQLTLSGGHWLGDVTSVADQFMDCKAACAPVGQPGTGYTIQASDVGGLIREREIATGSGGSNVAWSANFIGPVTSQTTGAAVLATGTVAVRNATGQTLASATVTRSAAVRTARSVRTALIRLRAQQRSGAKSHGPGKQRPGVGAGTIVRIRRAAGVRGRLRAWACPTALGPTGKPQACTRPVWLRRVAMLHVAGRGKIAVVVARP